MPRIADRLIVSMTTAIVRASLVTSAGSTFPAGSMTTTSIPWAGATTRARPIVCEALSFLPRRGREVRKR